MPAHQARTTFTARCCSAATRGARAHRERRASVAEAHRDCCKGSLSSLSFTAYLDDMVDSLAVWTNARARPSEGAGAVCAPFTPWGMSGTLVRDLARLRSRIRAVARARGAWDSSWRVVRDAPICLPRGDHRGARTRRGRRRRLPRVRIARPARARARVSLERFDRARGVVGCVVNATLSVVTDSLVLLSATWPRACLMAGDRGHLG
jgi:hypothetical protein